MTKSNHNPYTLGLDQNPANFTPLSPLSFISRAADVFPERTAVVHSGVRRNWRETFLRCP